MTMTSFHFAVINDLHYIDDLDRPWLEALVDDINSSDAELCLVLGDLAETGTLEELAAVKKIFDGLRMPYYTVPGNHDGPPNREPDLPDGAGLASYEFLFPNRRNYTFTHRDWQFVAIDTTNGSTWANVPLRSEPIAHARKFAAELDSHRPTILFTHFPIDPANRFNLLNAPDLVAALRPLNLRIVFSGHYHGLSETTIHGINTVTNRCCAMRRQIHDGTDTPGYFRCTANPDGSVQYVFTKHPLHTK